MHSNCWAGVWRAIGTSSFLFPTWGKPTLLLCLPVKSLNSLYVIYNLTELMNDVPCVITQNSFTMFLWCKNTITHILQIIIASPLVHFLLFYIVFVLYCMSYSAWMVYWIYTLSHIIFTSGLKRKKKSSDVTHFLNIKPRPHWCAFL